MNWIEWVWRMNNVYIFYSFWQKWGTQIGRLRADGSAVRSRGVWQIDSAECGLCGVPDLEDRRIAAFRGPWDTDTHYPSFSTEPAANTLLAAVCERAERAAPSAGELPPRRPLRSPSRSTKQLLGDLLCGCLLLPHGSTLSRVSSIPSRVSRNHPSYHLNYCYFLCEFAKLHVSNWFASIVIGPRSWSHLEYWL